MPTSGIRDNGWHHFTLSLVPHGGEADMPRLAMEAGALNLAAPAAELPDGTRLPALPFWIEGEGIELVAAKRPFGGEAGCIVRLLNLRPSAGMAMVMAAGIGELKVTVDRLTEDGPGAVLTGRQISVEMKPFEVKTVWVQAIGLGVRGA